MEILVEVPQIYRKGERWIIHETTTCEDGEPIRLGQKKVITERGLLKTVQQGSRRYVEKLCEILMQSLSVENAKVGEELYQALAQKKVDYYLLVTYLEHQEVVRVEQKEFEL